MTAINPFTFTSEHIEQLRAAFSPIFAEPMKWFSATAVATFPEPMGALRHFFRTGQHPMSKHLPLLDPVDTLFCAVAYFVCLLFFFLIGRLTGKLELRLVGIIHNLFLVVLSAYMAYGLGYCAVAQRFPTLWNNPIGSGPYAVAQMNFMWLFFISKVLEYVDTYIMVLKHNYRQVTFLHLFHHTSILIVCYFFVAIAPGGDGYWSPMVNSGIHVVMYSYYLLNLVFSNESRVKKFLQANKLIITYGQITQFTLNFLQAVYILYIVDVPRYSVFGMKVLLWYMIILVGLFTHFILTNGSGSRSRPSSPTSRAPANGTKSPTRRNPPGAPLNDKKKGV